MMLSAEMKMNYSCRATVFKLTVVIWVFLYSASQIVECQRPSSGGRMDVYIAGFFPYGDRVENSDIGRGVVSTFVLIHLISI